MNNNNNKNNILETPIPKFDKLIYKIRNIDILSNDDIIYIKTLPNEKLLHIIYAYNAISNVITDFLEKSY
jgi:hypothetical protein